MTNIKTTLIYIQFGLSSSVALSASSEFRIDIAIDSRAIKTCGVTVKIVKYRLLSGKLFIRIGLG